MKPSHALSGLAGAVDMMMSRSIFRSRSFGGAGLRLACLLMVVALTPVSGLCQEVGAQDLSTGEQESEEQTVIAEPEETDEEVELPSLVVGLRTGIAIPTGKILENMGSGVDLGPLLNFEALYPLKEWVRVGMMLEYHMHDINTWGPKFGRLAVFSLLPTIEFRPTRGDMLDRGIDWVIPYVSLGTGINFHNFRNDAQLGNASVSFSNTFALRLAGGLDIPIAPNLYFNTELAWNRDSGTYKLNGAEANFNASSVNLLIGLRAEF